MKKILFITTVLATTALTGAALADTLPIEGKWMVRGRAITLSPANDGGDSSIGGKPSVGSDTVPEIDVTYFVTPNIGIELIAATTEHNAKVDKKATITQLGTTRLLPPTLTAQYHFNLDRWKPYIGAGVTYAHFYDSDHPGLASVKYDDAWGVALQAGVDYKVRDKWYWNADVKKIAVSTDVTVNDTITAKANLNPWVFGTGIGYRF